MENKCTICKSKYEIEHSKSNYFYAYCSIKCEEESEQQVFRESNEPAEFLKDDYLELQYSARKLGIVFKCKQGDDERASVLELKNLILLKKELEKFINKMKEK